MNRSFLRGLRFGVVGGLFGLVVCFLLALIFGANGMTNYTLILAVLFCAASACLVGLSPSVAVPNRLSRMIGQFALAVGVGGLIGFLIACAVEAVFVVPAFLVLDRLEGAFNFNYGPEQNALRDCVLLAPIAGAVVGGMLFAFLTDKARFAHLLGAIALGASCGSVAGYVVTRYARGTPAFQRPGRAAGVPSVGCGLPAAAAWDEMTMELEPSRRGSVHGRRQELYGLVHLEARQNLVQEYLSMHAEGAVL
jgi:hypothetical protein